MSERRTMTLSGDLESLVEEAERQGFIVTRNATVMGYGIMFEENCPVVISDKNNPIYNIGFKVSESGRLEMIHDSHAKAMVKAIVSPYIENRLRVRAKSKALKITDVTRTENKLRIVLRRN